MASIGCGLALYSVSGTASAKRHADPHLLTGGEDRKI
jgi:hypothetical protein